jgi:RHH-type proline utilization regulon transcriptional repressor/proline dehydrogenase/delta 1-pyrroline-5-carboxylate dehydrogenase
VIDAEARAGLFAHLQTHGATLGRVPAHGCFVAPAILPVTLDTLPTREVFGPVLHVLRFDGAQIPALVDRLNAAGFGLTHGIHSRIDTTVDAITSRIRAGNIYVNRNIVGAVVGVQPFGGEGLSGTGPKAGGPLILHRLVRGTRPALPRSVTLPSPTGERNTLELHPRGGVLCDARGDAARAAQMAALREAGCVAADTGYAAVLTDAEGEALVSLRRRLAASDGPIIPVITPEADGSYPAWRLLAERCISVNTAAAGGNAALLGAVA